MTEEAAPDGATSEAEPGRGPSLRQGLGLLAVAFGLGSATFALDDNSFLTHLATGRLILADGSVPTADPYSFTAPGAEWTVQSWLASVTYAGAEAFGGGVGLRVLVMAVFALSAWLVWRLADAATGLLPRIAIVFTGLAIGATLWSERPYMIAVIGFGVLQLWLRTPSWRPWLLVPLLWVWANTHGSFVLGVVLLAAVTAGRRLDGRDVRHEVRLVGWSIVGVLAAAVSPLGPKLLLFPVTALSKSDLLGEIAEWRAPSYELLGERLYLLLLLAAVVSLVRRPSWQHAVPSVLFVAAAAVALRNIVLATMVLVPVVAEGLGDAGSMRVDDRGLLARPMAAVGSLAIVLVSIVGLTTPVAGFSPYPAAAVVWLEPQPEARTATQDPTGNLLEVLDGPTGEVFFDDRIDMYPRPVVEDFLTLNAGRPGWDEVLDRWEIERVVWRRTGPIASLLVADDRWRISYADEWWLIAERR